jgi:hypothetical protein
MPVINKKITALIIIIPVKQQARIQACSGFVANCGRLLTIQEPNESGPG